MILLFRGGPMDGLQVEEEWTEPPAKMTGGLATSVDGPPTQFFEYHRTDWFFFDAVNKVKGVLYVWQRT